jgi:hypothetical protein
MKMLRGVFSQLAIVGEIFAFLWARKLWWLIPMMVVLMLLGLLIIFAQVTGIGPFIYTLF